MNRSSNKNEQNEIVVRGVSALQQLVRRRQQQKPTNRSLPPSSPPSSAPQQEQQQQVAAGGDEVSDDVARNIAEQAVAKIESFWARARRFIEPGGTIRVVVGDSDDATASRTPSAREQRAALVLQRHMHRRVLTKRRTNNTTTSNTNREHHEGAATRIQRLWRRYRDAVENYEALSNQVSETMTNNEGHLNEGADAMVHAAFTIQQQWRRYQQAVQEEAMNTPEGGDTPTSPVSCCGEPDVHDEAAHRIQNLWKRYRSALHEAARLEQSPDARHGSPSALAPSATASPPSPQPTSQEDVQRIMQQRIDAARVIEQSWLKYSSAVRETDAPLRGIESLSRPPDASDASAGGQIQDNDVDNVVAAFALEGLLMRDFDEPHDGPQDLVDSSGANTARSMADELEVDPDLQLEELFLASVSTTHSHAASQSHSTAANESFATSVSAATSVGTASSRQHGAALVIQRFYSRWVRQDGDSLAAPSAPPLSHVDRHGRRYDRNVVQALSMLQHRFRFQRLRRIVLEQDREAAIRRVQELWRRRRDIRQHFERLRQGRVEAAARRIQNAYRGYRSATRNPTSPTVYHQHTTSPAAPLQPSAVSNDDEDRIPRCIVCISNPVQVALLPCGHAQMCSECAAHLRRCPVCRKDIALQVRIYL